MARASTVFVDWRDGVYFNPVASANFDLYFKAHFAKYVRSFNASGNVRVGSFYLTNRILSAARAARAALLRIEPARRPANWRRRR